MIYRRVFAIAVGAVLALSLIATVIYARWSWYWSPFKADSMAAVGTVFSAGTLILATVAGGIALLAYLAAIQPPDLMANLISENWEQDRPVFSLDPPPDLEGFLGVVRLRAPGELTIRITNKSRFAARNAACRVEAKGFAGLMPVAARGENWSVLHGSFPLVDVLQWDGGVDYVVHGDWPRDIHLVMNGGVVYPGPWQLVVEVVADGFRKPFAFPVEILSPAAWRRRFPERANEIPEEIRDREAPEGYR